jgi:hypothetical protein
MAGVLLRAWFEVRLEPGDLRYRRRDESYVIHGVWGAHHGRRRDPKSVAVEERIARATAELRRRCAMNEVTLWACLMGPDGLRPLQPFRPPAADWPRVQFWPKTSRMKNGKLTYVHVEVHDALSNVPAPPVAEVASLVQDNIEPRPVGRPSRRDEIIRVFDAIPDETVRSAPTLRSLCPLVRRGITSNKKLVRGLGDKALHRHLRDAYHARRSKLQK